MYDAFQYGWPHRQTLGKRPENNVQQMMMNIHVGRVEKLLSGVFLLLLSATEE